MRTLNNALNDGPFGKLKCCGLAFAVAAVALIAMLASGITSAWAQAGRAGNPVYTVSNFQVWAEAKDAVSAKRAALEDGRVIALRVLMKRLTLMNSYSKLPDLPSADIGKLITSLSVQDERNSTTEYIANMDFQFSSSGVKQLLRSNQIPFYDRQGPEVVLVPVVDKSLLRPAGPNNKPAMSQNDWETSWSTLDLAHGLVPLKLANRAGALDDSVLIGLIRGEKAALEGLYSSYQGRHVVVALISSAQSTNKLRLTLVGRDGVGDIIYKRDHVVTNGNLLQAADLAAEVAQGMFEQRLKILNLRTIEVAVKKPVEVLPWQTELQEAAPVTGWQGEVGGARIAMHVEFSGLGAWQRIRRRLVDVPGLDDLNVEKLSARGADVSCQYPGGVEALSRQLAALGMRLEPGAGGWVLRGS